MKFKRKSVLLLDTAKGRGELDKTHFSGILLTSDSLPHVHKTNLSDYKIDEIYRTEIS